VPEGLVGGPGEQVVGPDEPVAVPDEQVSVGVSEKVVRGR
jgi:hypothetical protein